MLWILLNAARLFHIRLINGDAHLYCTQDKIQENMAGVQELECPVQNPKHLLNEKLAYIS